MKDLDFDELDRAVNSLMTDVPKTDVSGTPDQEKTLDITPTLSDNSVPSFDKLEEATAKTINASTLAKPTSAVQTSSDQASPAAHRAGRFMDVVHPSSDMKKPTTVISPRSSVSRQGVTIEPRALSTSSLGPEASAKPATAPKPEELAAAEEEKSTPVEPSAPLNEWPDPLEVADFKTPTESKKSKVWETPASSEPAKKQLPASPASSVGEEGESTSLTSPFLPDTKVEKRPLGNSVTIPVEEPDHTPVIGADAEEAPATTADPDDQLPASPAAMEPQLPEELQGDLMAIEADTTTHHDLPKTEEAQPVKDKPVVPERTPKAVAPVSIAVPDEPLLTAGLTSIPQQYREEPSTGESANGAIYDTDSYHQPLVHPAKKKSGWLWVMWIVLILLIGAGGGAALYFLGII